MRKRFHKNSKARNLMFLQKVITPLFVVVYIITGLLLPVTQVDLYTRAQNTPANVQEFQEPMADEESVAEEPVADEVVTDEVTEEAPAGQSEPEVALDGEGDDLGEVVIEEPAAETPEYAVYPEEELFDCMPVEEEVIVEQEVIVEEEIVVEEEAMAEEVTEERPMEGPAEEETVVEEEIVVEEDAMAEEVTDERPMEGPAEEETVVEQEVIVEEVTDERPIEGPAEEVAEETAPDYEVVEVMRDGKLYTCKRVISAEGPAEEPAEELTEEPVIEEPVTRTRIPLMEGSLNRERELMATGIEVSRIKLADVNLRGKKFGDEISLNQAVEALISLTTAEEDLEKAVIRSVFKRQSTNLTNVVLADGQLKKTLSERVEKGLLETLGSKIGKTIASQHGSEALASDLITDREIKNLLSRMLTDSIKKELIIRVVHRTLQGDLRTSFDDDVAELVKVDYNKFLLEERLGVKLRSKPSTRNVLLNLAELKTEELNGLKAPKPIISIMADGPSGRIPISVKNLRFESGSVFMIVDPLRQFKPGLYAIAVDINNPVTGLTETITQDFAWGVLAMNTGRDVYKPGDKAFIEIGVLDNLGRPVCDAEVILDIEAPNGAISRVAVENTGTCTIFDSLNTKPDYSAEVLFTRPGQYILRLKATLRDGQSRIMNSAITVSSNPPFVIERKGATRLFPQGISPMSIDVYFNQDFDGFISDIVPADFVVSGVESTGKAISNNGEVNLSQDGQVKLVTWKVKAKAGNFQSFRYFYDAPDNSIEFYTVGPLNSSGSLLEARRWQIANDAPPLSGITPKVGAIGGGTIVSLSASGYDANKYYQPVTVDNRAGVRITDYEFRLSVDTASLISAQKMNSDCSDLNFVAPNKTEQLYYWIERGVGYDTCNKSDTAVWVRMPGTMSAGERYTIYMKYGSGLDYTAYNNGERVFNFFDDFNAVWVKDFPAVTPVIERGEEILITSVLFNETRATDIKVTGSGNIYAVAPAHEEGTVSVTAHDHLHEKSAILEEAFIYVGAPVLTEVSPKKGPYQGGTAITLTGTDFYAPMTVTLGESACTSVKVLSDTEATCITGPSVQASETAEVDVMVSTNFGAGTLESAYTYIARPAFTGITPEAVGSLPAEPVRVTVTGTDFYEGARNPVQFYNDNDRAYNCEDVTFESETELTCTVPAGLPGDVDYKIYINTPSGRAISETPVFYVHSRPQVNQAYFETADGAYKAGDTIRLQVQTDKPVIVTGKPRLMLETGDINHYAIYRETTDEKRLTFDYVIQPGDVSGSLDYLSAIPIDLNEGSITDEFGQNLDPVFPAPGTLGSLSFGRHIVIDISAPNLVSQTVFEDAWYNLDQTSVFNFTDEESGIEGDDSRACVINTEGEQQTCVLENSPEVCNTAGLCADFNGTLSNTIKLDKTPPESGIIRINIGDECTDVPAVTLTLFSSDALSGVHQMRFSCDAENWTVPEAFSATRDFNLNRQVGAGCNTAPGLKTVYARFSDLAGNWSEPVSDTITHDSALLCREGGIIQEMEEDGLALAYVTSDSPFVSYIDGKLYYNNNAESPSNFTLHVTARDSETGIVEVRGSDAFGDRPASTLAPYTLDYSIEQGSICPESKLIITSIAGSDSTESLEIDCLLDGEGPTGGFITYDNGFRNRTDLRIGVSPGTDAVSGMSKNASDYLLEYRMATLADASCGEFSDWTDSRAEETPEAADYRFEGEDNHCYEFRYTVKDRLGNQNIYTGSGPAMIDTQATMLNSIVINKGAETTSNPAASLTLTAKDSIKSQVLMQFSCDFRKWSTPEPFVSERQFDLTRFPDAGCNADAGEKTVYVRFSNGNGSWSGIISDSILYFKSKVIQKPLIPERRNNRLWGKDSMYEDFIPEQELKEFRDAYSKSFRSPSGKITAAINAAPIHYEENGRWKEIIDDYEPNTTGLHTDYEFATANNKVKRFSPSKSGRQGKMFDMGDGRLYKDWLNPTMEWVDAEGKTINKIQGLEVQGVADDNRMIYTEVFENTDVIFTQGTISTQMDILLKSETALGDIPEGATSLAYCEDVVIPANWTYEELKTDSDYPGEVTGVVFKDAQGQEAISYPQPEIYELNDTSQVIRGTYTLNKNGQRLKVCKNTPTEWLTAPQRQFPVVVDPTAWLGAAYQTGATNWSGTVGGTSGTKWNGSADIGCWTSGTCPTTTEWRRGFAFFPTTIIMDGSTVTYAYVRVRSYSLSSSQLIYATPLTALTPSATGTNIWNACTSYPVYDYFTISTANYWHYFCLAGTCPTSTGDNSDGTRNNSSGQTQLEASIAGSGNNWFGSCFRRASEASGTAHNLVRFSGWSDATTSYRPMMRVDYTTPTISVSVTTPYSQYIFPVTYYYVKGGVTMTFDGTDIGSGSCTAYWDTNTTFAGTESPSAALNTNCDGTLTAPTCTNEVTYYGCIRAVDGNGAVANYACRAVTCDTVAPSAPTISCGSYTSNVWRNDTAPTCTWNATGGPSLESGYYCTTSAICTPSTYSSTRSVATGFAEGTSYFRARNEDLGGTGNISTFAVRRDQTAPSTAATTIDYDWYGPASGTYQYSTTTTIKGSAADSHSGISSVAVRIEDGTGNYFVGSGWVPDLNWESATVASPGSTSTTWYYSGLTAGYLINGGEYTVTARATDGVSLQTTGASDTFRYDSASPTGGSVSYTNGYHTNSTITVNVNRGTDALSGMSPTAASYLLEYRSATLSNGSCGTYGSWTDAGVNETATATSYNFSASNGFCYQFRYTVRDLVGNPTTYTSGSVTKVDTTAPSVPTNLSYHDGYNNWQSDTVTWTNGADSESGIAGHHLFYNRAPLSNGVCGTYLGWSSEAGYETSPFAVAGMYDGWCYMYYIQAVNNAGLTSNTTTSPTAVTKVDASPPTSNTISINSGAAYTNNAATTLTLSSTDTTSGVSQMQFSCNNTNWTTAETYATSKAFNLTNQSGAGCNTNQGSKTVYVRYRDNANNWSSAVSSSIVYDTVAPTSNTISINSGAAYTNSASATLTLSSTDATSGVSQMQFSCNNSNWTTAETYATSKAFNLTNQSGAGCNTNQGSKTVYVRYRDNANNWSSAVSSSIVYDTVAPTVTINQASGQADPTNASPINFTVVFSESVTGFTTGDVTLSGTAGATTGTVTGSGTTYNVAVSGMTGSGTVIATIGSGKATDAAGNGNAASTSSDNTVTYDITNPTATIDYITTPRNTALGTVTGTSADNVGVSYVTTVLREGANCDAGNRDWNGSAWVAACTASVASTGTTSWSVTSTPAVGDMVSDKTYYMYVRAADAAGNFSAWINQAILFDNTGPTGSISNASGNPTNNTTPTLNLTIADTGVGTSGAQMQFSCNNSTWSPLEAYATPKTNFNIKPATTTYGCGTTDGSRTVYVRYRDSLGNYGSSYNTGAFTLDTTPPTATSVTTPAAYTNQNTFTVTASGVADNLSGVNAVRFPTWTTYNGQDDIQWFLGTNQGSGTWTYTVDKANHNNETGEYNVHVYGYDNAGNSAYLGAVIVGIDQTNPVVSANNASASWRGSNVTITLSTSDSGGSGLAYSKYSWDTSDATCRSSGTSFTNGNTITIPSEGDHTLYLCNRDNATNNGSWSGSYKLDTSAPINGSTTYTDGYQTSTAVTVNVNRGTDAYSGMSSTNSDYLLEYRSTALSAGSCGTYGSWTDAGVAETATATSYSYTATNGNCYQFRYTVKDVVGNTATFTGTSTLKVSTSSPTASCSVTEGTNPQYQYQTGTTIYYNSGYTGDFTVGVTAADSVSGIEKVNFPTLATGFSPSSTDDFTSPYSQVYSWNTSATTSPGAKNATVYSNSGLTNTCGFTVTRDVTAPTGTITYSTQYITSLATDPSMTIGSVTETGSGEDTSTRTLQRATATLSNNICGTYSSFTTTTQGGTYPNITDTGTITDATCYRYRWQVADNVGNVGTFTTTNEYKVDTTAPSTTVSGVTESSADIYYASGSKTVFYKTPSSNQNFTVNVDASDPQSGIEKVNFPGINVTGFSPTTATDDTSSPYSNQYTISSSATTSPGSRTVTGYNNAGLTQTDNFTVTVDNTAPTGASVSCPSAYDTDGSFNVTGTSGSDSGSGIDTANSYFQRRTGTLSGDACSGYGAYSNQGTANATNLGQASLASGCYEYRYYTVDLVGNSTTSSTCTVKVDTSVPTVSITSITESSAYIYDNGSTLYYNNTPATPGSFTINVSAADADTGIASVSGSTEFGMTPTPDTTSPYTLEYTIAQSSTCTSPITVTATNNAGASNNTTRTCTLDTTAPTSNTISINAGATYTNSASATLSLSSTDAGSGLNQMQFSCDNSTWTTAEAYATSKAFNLTNQSGAGCNTNQGTKTVYVRYSDNVGNWSSAVSDTITYDTVAPIISSITSVAGDTSAPYYDTTNDSSTSIIFVSSDATTSVAACKWNTTDVAYASMANTCASTTSCVANLSGEGAKTVYIRCIDAADNPMTSSTTVNYTVDATPPSGTSITPTSTRIIDNSYPSFTVSDGTDTISGINTNSRQLQRAEATYSNNTCGTYGSFSAVTYSGTYPNISDNTATGSKCYKYKWSVSDNAGNNTTTAETAVITRVPLTTISITAGNNQSYGDGTNNPIGYTLPTALQVRVTDGGTNWAVSNEVTVDFAITSVPISPTAIGQSLSATAVDTSSTGYASTSLTFGDRAGVYQVKATSTHTSITVEPTFSATAGQHFSLAVTEAGMTINLDASGTAADFASPTVSITTNAASFSIALTPNRWPRTALLNEILNWTGTLGFGWNLNLGTITAYSTSAGNPAATTVHSCSGDTCQGTNVINIDIHAGINYTHAPGTYTNTVSFSGQNISY